MVAEFMVAEFLATRNRKEVSKIGFLYTFSSNRVTGIVGCSVG